MLSAQESDPESPETKAAIQRQMTNRKPTMRFSEVEAAKKAPKDSVLMATIKKELDLGYLSQDLEQINALKLGTKTMTQLITVE